MKHLYILTALLVFPLLAGAQDYFLKDKGPFDPKIPSPETFLGYGIGEHHTRHDLIVAYFNKLAEVSGKAVYTEYGKTHEGRKLVILAISNEQNISNLQALKTKHIQAVDPGNGTSDFSDVPVFVNLGYNVHGNEPSSSEAAMLTAYTLIASQSEAIKKYRDQAVIFIDPAINPDGRDRHTQWANAYQGDPLVSDPADAEHNENWPRGRTNHYWFDLNRDWLLAVNPESKGKLTWYHEWYPNVVTDFHEMGSTSTYFFEPMKVNASKDPIMPKENYEDLNSLFATYYEKELNNLGSLYFTKEVFDGTYPGYGSSYPDLQGALALLFEQASSRGHVQDTPMGQITFPFTIRNQYTSSIATVQAAVENKDLLYKYQKDFFKSALSNASRSPIKAYAFKANGDKNREKAFMEKLLLHKIKVYQAASGDEYVVPTSQPQYRMVQTMFETYKEYRDSVYYDASAWSVANFYNMKYRPINGKLNLGQEITSLDNLISVSKVSRSDYAYIVNYADYNVFPLLNALLKEKIRVTSAFKPFTIATDQGVQEFGYGTLVIPVSKQEKSADDTYSILQKVQNTYKVPVYSVNTGFSAKGVDLGSGYMETVTKPKALMLIGDGTSSYEAGEVWHLLDTRVGMPVTKVMTTNFNSIDLDKYNTLILVSGSYNVLDSVKLKTIKDWISEGNTLITIGSASKWAIDKKLVKEKLVKPEKDKDSGMVERKPYVDAPENIGKESLGGAIFKVDVDVTHPLAFGYLDTQIPVYKNNNVWIKPSENEYATVTAYTSNPHIDGFITPKNLALMKQSASLIVSKVGGGRVVMFADNPNFRGSWYGTNRLFLNALFLGDKIDVPSGR